MSKIFLSVPILGRPELRMIYSMYQSILSCREHQVRVYFNENDSLISRVRNVHMSAFYYDYPECEYFMSWDSDIEVMNAVQYNNIFTKLISHKLDFVGGLYAIKKPGTRRCSSITLNGANPSFDTGLVEMRWLSSGCWCIHRSAVKKMIDAYPDLTYNGDDNAAGKIIHGLYIPMIYSLKKGDFSGSSIDLPFKKYLSEDWSWCERWASIGGKIFADTSLYLKHIGTIDYTIWDVEMVKRQNPQCLPQNNQVVPPHPGFDLENKNV